MNNHPSGCKVLSSAEFWAKLGAENGRSGAEEMVDFYAELRAEEDAEYKRLTDPTQLLIFLQKAIEGYNGDAVEYDDPDAIVPQLTEIKEVKSVSLSLGYRSYTKISAVATDEHGHHGTIPYNESHDPATYLDPPEDMLEIEWVPNE